MKRCGFALPIATALSVTYADIFTSFSDDKGSSWSLPKPATDQLPFAVRGQILYRDAEQPGFVTSPERLRL